MDLIYADLETRLISAGLVAPPIVCGQILHPGEGAFILKKLDLESFLKELLPDPQVTWIFQRAAFDLACICEQYPDLRPAVFHLLEEGRVIDVAIHEKLLMLGKHGWVDSRLLPDGSSQKVSYSLSDIVRRRLGIEMSGKSGASDDWRINFEALENVPLQEWPRDAVEYALEDVRVLPDVYHSQLEEGKEVQSTEPFATAPLHVAASFALQLMTCQGFPINSEERGQLESWIAAERAPEKEEPLYVCGILRRPVPSRPYVRHVMSAHRAMLSFPQLNYEQVKAGDWSEARPHLEPLGIKFTEPVAASRDMKVLRGIIVDACAKGEVEVQMTEGGKGEVKNPQVSTSDEFLAEIEHLDERLTIFHHRQQIEKLVTTELPRIQNCNRVHPDYDVLKETGRTSSFAGSLYPSCNIQNVHPRARRCYEAEPGHVLASSDYKGIEHVTFAQKCFDLFGKSTYRDIINAGRDTHAFLGAYLVRDFDSKGFQERIQRFDLTRLELYEQFWALKKLDPPYYKFWRTFAKPTGLGFPGGLGPDTMVTYAKGTYGVVITRDQASRCRDIWREVVPEAVDYFAWVNEDCKDGEDEYRYMSPMGMLRSRCAYCACANGAALQTPAAEGAKFAMFLLTRHCFDPSQKSLLYGCHPHAFIHDQFIVSIPEDGWMHERVCAIESDMIQGMKQVVRDVKVGVESCLMRKWSKDAEGVYRDGRLVVWEEEKRA